MTTKTIFFILILFCVSPNVIADERAVACTALQTKYEQGYLSKKERNSYCLNQCTFLRVDCGRVGGSSVSWSEFFDPMEKFANQLIDGSYDEFADSAFSANIKEDTVEAWVDMFSNSWTIFLAVIPVILNQWKYYNFWGAILINIFFVVFQLTGLSTTAITMHNVFISFLALYHSANSSLLVENVWTSAALLFPVYCMFISDSIWHVAILVATLCGFSGYLYWCFFNKKAGSHASVVVVILQIFVVIEQMAFVKERMFADNLIASTIDLVLFSVVPHGKRAMGFFNSVDCAVGIVRHVPGLPRVYVFLTSIFVQMTFFVMFRASLGAFYMHVLRYRCDLSSLSTGFFVYLSDFFGPIRCLLRLTFRLERYDTRRLLYAAVGITLLFSEMCWMREFAALRLLVSFVDCVFIQSNYNRTSYYLEKRIDFMQAAFPQVGAMPWVSLETLDRISQFTCVLKATDKKLSVSKGLGVVLNSGGRDMLYSVRHVVQDADFVQFLGQTVSSPDFRPLTGHLDPMVAMKVEIEEDPPDVELLRRAEIPSIDSLVFINTSNEENFICYVPEFKIVGDKLTAMVNLKRGDSGGPCFAVLKTGELRLCGVVSAGNPRSGGGNIISFCYHTENLSCDSSDDEELSDVKQFNNVRRRKFAGEVSEPFRLADELSNFIRDNVDFFKGLKEDKVHFDFEDFSRSFEDTYQDKFAGLDKGKPPDYDDEHDEEAKKKKQKNWDKRRRNKDKAYHKRAYMMLNTLKAYLGPVYTRKDARSIFNALAMGNTPVLSPREYIERFHDGSWLVADEPPAADWN